MAVRILSQRIEKESRIGKIVYMDVGKVKRLRIISIDPSLRSTGIFMHLAGERKFYVLPLRAGIDRENGLGIILARFSRILDEHLPFDIAVIEQYAFRKHSYGATTQHEVGGVYRAVLAMNGIPIVEMPIAIWQSYTIGRGHGKTLKADKEAYLKMVADKYGKLIGSPDTADAYLIFRSFAEILCGRHKTDKAKAIATLAETKLQSGRDYRGLFDGSERKEGGDGN